MSIQRLPIAIRVVVEAERRGDSWHAVAKVFDAYDLVGEALQPLPAVARATQTAAEERAYSDFKEWANRRWPLRTIPDPVASYEE